MLFQRGGVEWLLVFLGNPGLRYHGTRHNAGYLVGDALCRKLGVSIDRLRFRAFGTPSPPGGLWGVLLLFLLYKVGATFLIFFCQKGSAIRRAYE